MRIQAVIAIVLAGCYRPASVACDVACGIGDVCPTGLSCVAGMCTSPGQSCSRVDDAMIHDGVEDPDAPDASQPIDPDAPLGCLDGALLPAMFCPNYVAAITWNTPMIIDTGTECPAVVTDPGAPEQLCVFAAETITITAQANVRFVGSKPVVLVANRITVAGILDVSSSVFGDAAGSGHDPSCKVPMQDALQSPDPGGGGAGGTFATKGGIGGLAGASSQIGTAAAIAVVDRLKGGCDGGNGTTFGGIGGGAIYLRANQISIMGGSILAFGGAGLGTDAGQIGGGGGGSGGMLILNASKLDLSGGSLLATGGGGGGGGGTENDSVGGGGANGQQGPMPAGGRGGLESGQPLFASGGDGGGGSTSNSSAGGAGLAGKSGTASGGGGGGGGAGVLRMYDGFAPKAPDTFSATIVLPAP